MKRVLFCGLAVTVMATVAIASEIVPARSTNATSNGQSQVVPATDVPNLSPTPNALPSPSPLPLPSDESVYKPSNSSVYTPSGQSLNPPSTPVLTPQYPIVPMPVITQPVSLFPDVRYRATRNIAPFAVPTIVQVVDPCDRYCRTCVNVEICAPPCNPRDIRVTRDGNRVRYDYGKYSVVIRSVRDHVVVHYGD